MLQDPKSGVLGPVGIGAQNTTPVGMKTHTEYPDIFFWKYNSPYHIEMGTYNLIDLLWAGGSVAPAQPTSLPWNWGIFTQTCSTCLEGSHRKDSSGTHPCRAIDRAWDPRIPSLCSLKALMLHDPKSGVLSPVGIGAIRLLSTNSLHASWLFHWHSAAPSSF